MKNDFKKLSILSLVSASLILTPIHSSAYVYKPSAQTVNNNVVIGTDYNENNILTKLKEDIKKIENIKKNDIYEFKKNNEAWLDDVNSRLENYMENSDLRGIAKEEEKRLKLSELFGNNNKANGDMLYYYFDWESYGKRNGYMTHSMDPKGATRLLRYMLDDGWKQLGDKYSTIRSDNGSLYDQYVCHFEAVIEKEWNIEVGRPNVGLADTIKAGCNPT